MDATPRQPRSLGGGLLNAAKRVWTFRFIVKATTVGGWTPALLQILAFWLAAAALYAAAWVCLLISPSLAESEIAVMLYRTAAALLCGSAIVSPAVYGAAFRLRARRGFRSDAITAIIYAPIFGLTAGASFLTAAALSLGADGALSQSRLGTATSIALVMGPAFSALMAVGVRIGRKPPAPAPAIVFNRFYAPAEIVASIAALGVILSAPILAS